jgi:hypothetical protein
VKFYYFSYIILMLYTSLLLSSGSLNHWPIAGRARSWEFCTWDHHIVRFRARWSRLLYGQWNFCFLRLCSCFNKSRGHVLCRRYPSYSLRSHFAVRPSPSTQDLLYWICSSSSFIQRNAYISAYKIYGEIARSELPIAVLLKTTTFWHLRFCVFGINSFCLKI